MNKQEKIKLRRKKQIFVRSVSFITIFMILIFGVVACNNKKISSKIVFTTGFAKDELFRIEDTSCTLSEFMVYLTNTQNQYESIFGEEIWTVEVRDITLADNIKDTVLAKIAQIKTMNLLAEEEGIDLSEEEKENIAKASKEYFDSLNEKEIETLNITEEVIKNMYYEYALADKVYDKIIEDVNPEISDDEARTIIVEYILIRTYTLDGSGRRVEFSDEVKENYYTKAVNIYQEAIQEGSDFTNLVIQNSDNDEVQYSFRKGELDPAIEEIAFSLGNGEISNVIKTDAGFHIIKCISTFNREETDANKLKIVEQRKNEVFGQVYDEFVASLIKNINESLWEEVDLIHNSEIKTNDFFLTFHKYN